MITFILYLLFGGLFVYSGAVKAMDPGVFVMDVRSFDLLPDPYAAWLAMSLPWLEIIAGLAVISGIGRKGGLLILNGALLVFLIAISIAWYRGIDIQCGCFGDHEKESSHLSLLVRDVALFAFGCFLQWKALRGSGAILTPSASPAV